MAIDLPSRSWGTAAASFPSDLVQSAIMWGSEVDCGMTRGGVRVAVYIYRESEF
jgi:hypothetical protein